MYKSSLRPLLFRFDPEWVHYFTFRTLKKIGKTSVFRNFVRKKFQVEDPRLEREVFGLKFKNPVGLAAGFDKDAKLFQELSDLGFGFIEIGTVTPKPQSGNEKKADHRRVTAGEQPFLDDWIEDRHGSRSDPRYCATPFTPTISHGTCWYYPVSLVLATT